MADYERATGACLCGAVRFELRLPSKWCAHCHCTMCRRAHGAGYVTWVGMEERNFGFLLGADHVRWYASSSGAERGFCPTCGSTMFFRGQRWADEIHVALGCMDGPIDRQPQANAFYDTHVDWMPIDEALTVYRG